MNILKETQIKWLEEYWIANLTYEEKKAYIHSKWFYDKTFFWDIFLKHWKWKKTPNLHIEISDVLWWDDNTCVICPRWHWKTTTILIDIIHSLCYKIYWSQLYIAPVWLWSESLWKIKWELESNKLIQDVFWTLMPSQDNATKKKFGTKKWSWRQIQLLNGETIETLSKWQSVRWKRP